MNTETAFNAEIAETQRPQRESSESCSSAILRALRVSALAVAFEGNA
jgi:hypothetical protein